MWIYFTIIYWESTTWWELKINKVFLDPEKSKFLCSVAALWPKIQVQGSFSGVPWKKADFLVSCYTVEHSMARGAFLLFSLSTVFLLCVKNRRYFSVKDQISHGIQNNGDKWNLMGVCEPLGTSKTLPLLSGPIHWVSACDLQPACHNCLYQEGLIKHCQNCL